MRTNDDDQSVGQNLPLISPLTFRACKGDFEKKCDYLKTFALDVFNLFQWFGADSQDERLCSVEYIEHKLLRLLLAIREIYLMRGEQIRDECCLFFSGLLVCIDEKMRKIEKFVQEANGVLQQVLVKDSPDLTPGRLRLISALKDMAVHLHELTSRKEVAAMAEVQADKYNLHYDVKQFLVLGDSFSHQAHSVLNGLLLITIPSLQVEPVRDFGALFDRTLSGFCRNPIWETALLGLKARLMEEYEHREITTNPEKKEYLKRLWCNLSEREHFLLEKFGIQYANIRTAEGKAVMGRRLYESLNGLSSMGTSSVPPMTEEDLREYLLYVAQKQYLDGEIIKLEEPVKCLPLFPEKAEKEVPIFKKGVDCKLLADCLYEVYRHFFCDHTLSLKGRHNDSMALAAHLFIVIEKEGLGNSTLYNKGKKTFFMFYKEVAKVPVKGTEKTFYNRLTKDFALLRNTVLGRGKTVSDLNNSLYKDFQLVRRIFQGTKKYELLKTDGNG